MAHFNLFRSQPQAPATDTVNKAGGKAYSLGAEAALAQLCLTGTFNQTYYSQGADQLDQILKVSQQVTPAYLAQLALYSRQNGLMKDTPALLCAILAARSVPHLELVIHGVIDNGKMLRNFVQMVRSGVTGRRSLGSAPRRLVRQWFDRASDWQLLNASVGTRPSLADIIKMVHPTPKDPTREALYAYFLKKPHRQDDLPEVVQALEAFRTNGCGPLPKAPFNLLTGLSLQAEHWKELAIQSTWQTTRLNLNSFVRHGVFQNGLRFSDKKLTQLIANRLKNPTEIRKAKVFPYQLMTSYLHASKEVPKAVRLALQEAMETATENVPKIEGNIAIGVDVSGSMHSSVTGYRAGATSKMSCLDVASLIAAVILRKNPEAELIPFSDNIPKHDLNPFDSIMTNAEKLSKLPWGGTDCSLPPRYLNRKGAEIDALIMLSDNESWIDTENRRSWNPGTKVMKEWERLKKANPQAKLVCLDLQPNTHTQAPTRSDILNIGGFSDQVFQVIRDFLTSKGDAAEQLTKTIKSTPIPELMEPATI